MQTMYKMSRGKGLVLKNWIFTKKGVTRERHNHENGLRSVKKISH